jgi:hypothetical protein
MLTTTCTSNLALRRSASAAAAALKLAERDGIDVHGAVPVAPATMQRSRDAGGTRSCAMAQAAALRLEEAAC